jgi:hypothetical protein
MGPLGFDLEDIIGFEWIVVCVYNLGIMLNKNEE